MILDENCPEMGRIGRLEGRDQTSPQEKFYPLPWGEKN